MLTHVFIQAQRSTARTLIALATSLALCSIPCAAQSTIAAPEEAVADRWYQVEVILLAHKSDTDNEIWRSDIALAYPPNWTELKDPNELLIEAEACSPVDENTAVDQAGIDTETDSKAALLTSDEAQAQANCPQAADLDREPYYLLPKELHALNDQTQEFKWSRQHRVLFHQAWRQPIVDKTDATSIIINAGDTYGAHSELEGTISISVSRYLHLKTNLWFSEFAHNYGQDKGLWPELPTRPSQQEYSLTQIEESIESPWDRVQPLNDEYDKILDRPFVPEKITLIKQKRRMRSKEVHYIDHPKVGIVILVEPYEIPGDVNTDPEDNSINTEAEGASSQTGESIPNDSLTPP